MRVVESPVDVESRVGQIVPGADLGWVADVMAERRDQVLEDWLEATAKQPFHAGRRERAVADHIPHLFDAVVALLQCAAPRWVDPEAPLDDPAVLRAAQAHARTRFEQGLRPEDVVTEFRLLRQEIGRALRAHVNEDAPTGDVIGAELLVHDAIDGAITLGLSALTTRIEEVREEFLATTIHDTRQPITAVKGFAQMALRALDRSDPDLDAVGASLQRLNAEVDRMAELLATLTEISQLTLGRLSLRTAPIDLADVVRDAVRHLATDEAARVRLHISTGETEGNWDPLLLGRVVGNLLSNAVKYTPDRSPIELTVRDEGDTVRLTLSDQGIGLTPEEMTGLFRRYGRARGATERGIEGLGLGLYLSRGIIEAHGGRIWAESAGPDQGTTMQVVLPRSAPPQPGQQLPPDASSSATP